MILAALALAGCASGDKPVAKAPQLPAADDACGAGAMRYLVGKPKTQIPVATDPKKWRVTCTTCPVTLDYSPIRLNILYDQASGIVKEVKCG